MSKSSLITTNKATQIPSGPSRNLLIPSGAYAILVVSFLWLALFKGVLVDNPVQSMTETLPFLTVIQIGYCIFGGLEELIPTTEQPQKKQQVPSALLKRSLNKKESLGLKDSLSVGIVYFH